MSRFSNAKTRDGVYIVQSRVFPLEYQEQDLLTGRDRRAPRKPGTDINGTGRIICPVLLMG